MEASPSQNLQTSTLTTTLDATSWEYWKLSDAEIRRWGHSLIPFGDKILMVGGSLHREGFSFVGDQPSGQNIVLIDPEKRTLKILPSTGNVDLTCFWSTSVCYWKDSKLIAYGSWKTSPHLTSMVRIITLVGLDSENPSAYWEKVETTSKLHRSNHLSHVHNNKMYVFGGVTQENQRLNDVWSLDLETFAWRKCQTDAAFYSHQAKKHQTAFSENKLYNLTSLEPETVISEFDFETHIHRRLTGPALPRSTINAVCQQIIDQKLYVQTLSHRLAPISKQIELWVYDLEANKWTEHQTLGDAPSQNENPNLLFLKNRLILDGGHAPRRDPFGEFWSLPLVPKKNNSATPANITQTQQTMKQFFIDAPYSDISFEVESQVIKAHKWWLCKKSKYFANMFTSGMLEAQASQIKIPDIKASTFQAFLEFLYSDHVDLDEDLALDLLRQADKYSIPELKKECESYLAKNLTPKNYGAVAEAAEILDIGSLREAVVNYIAKNIKELKKQKDFENLSDAVLRESIVKFIVK